MADAAAKALAQKAEPESQETQEVLVRATQRRRRLGGIWRFGYFITLEPHRLNLTESQINQIASDPGLEIVESPDEDATVIEEEATQKSVSEFPASRNLVNPMLEGNPEDGDESDEDEDDDNEVNKLLKKQPSTRKTATSKSTAKASETKEEGDKGKESDK